MAQFNGVIEKAMNACLTSKNNIEDDFTEARKIVNADATTKKIKDYKLYSETIRTVWDKEEGNEKLSPVET